MDEQDNSEFERIRRSLEDVDAQKIEIEEGFRAIVEYYKGVRSTGLGRWDSAALTAAFLKTMGEG